MEVFREPPRKVYVHPTEELSVKTEELKSKVAFKGVPVEITNTVDLGEWLKATHDVVDVLSAGGWMEISSVQAVDSLPPEFVLHVRRKPPPPPPPSADFERGAKRSRQGFGAPSDAAPQTWVIPSVSQFWQKVCNATQETISVMMDTELVTEAVEITPFKEEKDEAIVYRRRKYTDATPKVMVSASTLSLEDGTVFPFKEASVLLIRRVYNKFMEMATRILKGQCETRHLFVTGTPGTGKTFFGFYLLYKLRIDPDFAESVIIWEEGGKSGHGMSLLFKENGVVCGKPGDFDKYLDKDTIYIVNGPDPPVRTMQNIGHVFLCFSTKDSIGSVWQFLKDHDVQTVYMPLWDPCELVLAGQLKGLGQEIVLAQYAKWGGSARSVLSHYKNLEYQKRFETALRDAQGKAKIQYTVGNVLLAKDSSSFILHLNVLNDDCTATAVVFASNYVREQLEKMRNEDDLKDTVEYLASNSLNSDEGVVVGRRFEILVHKLFSSTNIANFKFKARELNPPDMIIQQNIVEQSFQLHGGYKHFHKLEDIKIGVEGYYVPDYSKYPCYDSLILFNSGSMALQVTVNTKHDAKFTYVKTLIDNWRLKKFFFVVPERLFHEYPYQKLLHGSIEHEWPCEVWVLGVPSDFFNFYM